LKKNYFFTLFIKKIMLQNVSNKKILSHWLKNIKKFKEIRYLAIFDAYPSQTGHSGAPGELLIQKEHRIKCSQNPMVPPTVLTLLLVRILASLSRPVRN
jgi:hypothetical protein